MFIIELSRHTFMCLTFPDSWIPYAIIILTTSCNPKQEVAEDLKPSLRLENKFWQKDFMEGAELHAAFCQFMDG